MAYVPVPKDMSRIKDQGNVQPNQAPVALFWRRFSHRHSTVFLAEAVYERQCGNTDDGAFHVTVFLLALYGKNGQPLEKIICYNIQAQFVRSK